MTSRPILATALAAALLLAACGDAPRPQPAVPDRAAHVARLDEAYSAALFDSIAWPSDSLRLLSGNEVFVSNCRKCHGSAGQGGTAYAREHSLDVPSLVRADWDDATLDVVRRRIYTGHDAGMPSWGDARLTPREIDAAAFYVVERLRPEAAAAGRGR